MQKFYKSNNHSNRVRFFSLALLGILLILTGLASLILSIFDLFKERSSVHNNNEFQGALKTENPLWPSSGKGFWIGLVLIVTGVAGVLAWREGTRSSIIGFTVLSTISTCLSFYMIITCIVPTQYNIKYQNEPTPSGRSNDLTTNSLLIMTGIIGSVIGAITSIVSCIQADLYVNQREPYLYNHVVNNNVPETPLSIKYPTVPGVSRLGYTYQEPSFRVIV